MYYHPPTLAPVTPSPAFCSANDQFLFLLYHHPLQILPPLTETFTSAPNAHCYPNASLVRDKENKNLLVASWGENPCLLKAADNGENRNKKKEVAVGEGGGTT